MHQVGRKVRKVVRQLTDPHPEFVSLVDHGAIQKPFLVVRSAGSNAEGTDMDPVIANITFAKANFADELSVTTYLTQKGYADFKVAAVDAGFEVVSRAISDFDPATLNTIEGGAGVVMKVGKLTEAAQKADADAAEAVAKASGAVAEVSTTTTADAEGVEHEFTLKGAAELVKRWSEWRAESSSGVTLADVMSDGADGLPPGMQEVFVSFITALRNSVLTGNADTVTSLCTEFGTLVNRMAKTFRAGTVPAELAQKVADHLFGIAAEVAPVAEVTTEAAAADAPVVEGAVVETVEKSTEAPEAEKPVVTDEVDQKIEKAVAPLAAAMTGLVEQMAAVAKAVTDSTAAQTKGLDEVREQVTKASERVTAIEGTQQTRKSADATGEAEGTRQVETAPATKVNRGARNLLGFQNPAK